MSRNITTIIFSLFLFHSLFVSAQNSTNKEQPLSVILETITETFHISFSYVDENIQNKTLALPSNNLSIEDIITYLEKETNLVFQKLSNNSYAIRDLISNNEANTQYLKEVLITKFLTEGISLKTDGTSEINLEEFGILPGLIEPDILQTIQALPGVISVDDRVSNLNIRGGTNDQNLILWDGIKMYQSGHFFGLISAFNPSLIKTVTVSKNGSSAKYGDGVSSIIDMRTSDSISNRIHGGFGSNLISTDGFVKIPLKDKIELQVSARRSLTDVFSTPTYNQYFDRIFQDSDLTNQENQSIAQDERFYFYDLSTKLSYKISPKDRLTICGLRIFNSLDYSETSINETIISPSSSELIQESLALGLDYNRTWNSKLETTLKASLSKYDLYSKNFDISNNQRLIQENDVMDNRLEFELHYRFNTRLHYLGGYQYSEIGMSNLEEVNNPNYRRYIKDVLRTHGLFNEIYYKSNSGNTKASMGLRANYIEQFSDFFLEPRITFNQNISKDIRFEVLAELKSQTASQIIDLQNDFLGIEKRRWVLSNNEDIPVMHSQQISLGAHYQKNKLLVSLEGYIKHVDGITTRSQGFQNQFQYTNATGSYVIKGIDFLVNKQFNSFSTWLSYSFSKNDYMFLSLNNGNNFPNNIDIRHQATFAGTYSLNNLKLALGLNWHSGKPITNPSFSQNNSISNIVYEVPNSNRLEDYFRSDFSGNYTIKYNRSKLVFGLSVWNLINTSNTINSYYIKENNNLSQINTTSLGITLNGSVRFYF